jgi:hypothetical protein
MLVQTKAETHGIERNNFRQRHWCGRFRRKTCIVSRSMLMIDLTISFFPVFISTVLAKKYYFFVIIHFEILSERER